MCPPIPYPVHKKFKRCLNNSHIVFVVWVWVWVWVWCGCGVDGWVGGCVCVCVCGRVSTFDGYDEQVRTSDTPSGPWICSSSWFFRSTGNLGTFSSM
jgi:hypothetical protein